VSTNLDLIETFKRFKNDPTLAQRHILDLMEQNSNGVSRVLDASNPVGFMTESIASMGTAIMEEITLSERRTFRSLAQTPEEIYFHMADRDHLDIFAIPAIGYFKLLLNVQSIYKYAVDTGDGTGVRKLTIPKHTEFTVASTTFTMQYPVDIIVMDNMSINVHYDTSENSPLLNIKEHTVKQVVRRINQQPYIEIAIPCPQITLNTFTAKLNAVTEFTRSYNFKDKFYYCRAYIKNDTDATWTEISVTMNPSVYDIQRPTVCCKVLNGLVEISVPQIYFTNGLIEDAIRFDIYTTRGPIEMVMSNFVPGSAYSANWRDLDTIKTSVFSAPLNIFPDYTIYSDEVIIGGSNGKSFNKLRDQVIRSSRDRDGKIITEDQLEYEVNDRGYDLILDVDNLTDRVYLASREIPKPSNLTTSTGIGCLVSTLSTDMSKMYLHGTVRDHDKRITILPSTLYRRDNGILSIVDSELVQSYMDQRNSNPDALANIVNNVEYLYSPFHYIMDITTETFATRAYYMQAPKIKSCYYYQSNDSLGLVAAIQRYEIIHKEDGTGYRLAVVYEGSTAFQKLELEQIHVQLSYNGDNGSVVVNGVPAYTVDSTTKRPINGQYIYLFDIDTTFDIDRNHNLILGNASAVPLDIEFDIVIAVQDYTTTNSQRSDIDDLFVASTIPAYSLNSTYYGFVHEKMNIVLGRSLEQLWTRSRTVTDETRYKRYADNVQKKYKTTEWQRDEEDRIVFDAQMKPIVVHQKGDLVFDANGDPEWEHVIGSIMYDEFGDPIIEGGDRGLLRQFDLVMFDGIYYFANSPSTTDYVDEAIDAICTWVNTDMALMNEELINRSKLYYFPKTTMGNIRIRTTGSELEVAAYQNFKIIYYMTSENYRNNAIHKYVKDSTASIISEVLTNKTIAKDDIIEALRNAMKPNITSVEVSGFMDDAFNIITLTDTSMSPTIGKRLIVDSDSTLIVEDSISIEIKEQA
jgi:hypothetical protein